MIRTAARTSFVVGLLWVAAPASAQVVHSVNFGVGGFMPRGIDSRVAGDVLVENLSTTDPLLFNVKDFRNVSVLGEWNIGFGERIEVSAGIGYYSKKVPSIYRDLVNGHFTDDPRDDTEIQQQLGLRVIPLTGIVRFLPGRSGSVQPYIGAGIGVFPFRYSEVGDFVDTSDGTIFPARYSAARTAVGPVLVGGVRFPIRGDIYGITFEGRYQWATGDISGVDEFGNPKFLTDKIDLGGGSIHVGFLVRF